MIKAICIPLFLLFCLAPVSLADEGAARDQTEKEELLTYVFHISLTDKTKPLFQLSRTKPKRNFPWNPLDWKPEIATPVFEPLETSCPDVQSLVTIPPFVPETATFASRRSQSNYRRSLQDRRVEIMSGFAELAYDFLLSTNQKHEHTRNDWDKFTKYDQCSWTYGCP